MKKIKSRKEKLKNKNILKLIIMFIVVIFGIGKIGIVDAGMNDSVIEKNRIENVYAVTTLNGQPRIFYLNMYTLNGKVSYCIELGVDITTNIYNSTNDFSLSYLSSDQVEYIRSISYFGYKYYAHDDYRYYMAAQEIIWEYLSGVNIEWTNELNVNGQRIDIEWYKNDILEKRKRFYDKLSFNWIDGKKYYNSEKIILKDYAETLSDYEIVNIGYSNVSIDGNNLVIDVSSDYIGYEEIILRKKKYYNYDSMLYYYDNSQRLISNGNFNDLTRKLYFQIVGRKMKVQVVDSQTKQNISSGQALFEGAKYELYNDKGIILGTYITNKDGYFEINDLPYGKYYFKQIEASEGYLKTDEEIMVEFSDESDLILLEQKIIYNDIEIRKKYGDGELFLPEGDISFDVFDNNDLLFEKLITDVNGEDSIRLPYGTYKFVQNNTTYGYSKVLPFEVVVDKVKEDKVIYNLVDDLIQYKVIVNTIDNESGKAILSDNIVYKVKKVGEDDYISYDNSDEFITNNEGILVFPMLFSYGDYILEQVAVPDGYLNNLQVFEFSINDKTEYEYSDEDVYFKFDVYNKIIKGNLNILVTNEVFESSLNHYGYKKEPISESKLFLIANRDILINGDLKYQNDDKIFDVITDENGQAIVNNLYLGSYCLISESLEKKECFEIDINDSSKEFVEKNIEITNLLEKGNIYIKNLDEFGKNIIGNVFEIYDENRNMIYTGITNDEGSINVDNLVYGNYCIKQKDVSSSFVLLKEEKCIYLNGDEFINFINNKYLNNKIWVPNTLSNDLDLMIFYVVCLVGVVIVVYKKIFVSN